MNLLKIIKNEREHQQALARLMILMDLAPENPCPEADEMDVLAVLIEKYEEKEFPIDTPDPIEAIKFRMEQADLSPADLKPYIGSPSKVSEVLNKKRPLSLNMIRKLSDGLGISADVLIREPVQNTANQAEIDWNAFPLAEMRKRRYFGDTAESLQEIREYAAERITRFLSNIPGGLKLQPAMLRTSAHLRSNNKTTDPYALWTWQAQVLLLAQQDKLESEYIPGTVNADFMRKVSQMSWSSQGPALAKEFLNKHGIHLVYEPHFPKTYLDGAVCKTENGNPVIALTLRHDRLDNFWFTLMHELAHVALHLDKNIDWFIDDLESGHSDPMETEADALAENSLIPTSEWNPNVVMDIDSINRLSVKLNIHPCIIAGRIRHERKDHKLFGKKFRNNVTL